jgi:hypothetical protein
MKFSKKIIDTSRLRTEERIGFYTLATVEDLYSFIEVYARTDPEAPIIFDIGNKDLVIERLETDEEVIERLTSQFKEYQKLKDKFEN